MNNKFLNKIELEKLLNDYFPTSKKSLYSLPHRLDSFEMFLFQVGRDTAKAEIWTIEHIATLMTGFIFIPLTSYKSKEKDDKYHEQIGYNSKSLPLDFKDIIDIKKIVLSYQPKLLSTLKILLKKTKTTEELKPIEWMDFIYKHHFSIRESVDNQLQIAHIKLLPDKLIRIMRYAYLNLNEETAENGFSIPGTFNLAAVAEFFKMSEDNALLECIENNDIGIYIKTKDRKLTPINLYQTVEEIANHDGNYTYFYNGLVRLYEDTARDLHKGNIIQNNNTHNYLSLLVKVSLAEACQDISISNIGIAPDDKIDLEALVFIQQDIYNHKETSEKLRIRDENDFNKEAYFATCETRKLAFNHYLQKIHLSTVQAAKLFFWILPSENLKCMRQLILDKQIDIESAIVLGEIEGVPDYRHLVVTSSFIQWAIDNGAKSQLKKYYEEKHEVIAEVHEEKYKIHKPRPDEKDEDREKIFENLIEYQRFLPLDSAVKHLISRNKIKAFQLPEHLEHKSIAEILNGNSNDRDVFFNIIAKNNLREGFISKAIMAIYDEKLKIYNNEIPVNERKHKVDLTELIIWGYENKLLPEEVYELVTIRKIISSQIHQKNLSTKVVEENNIDYSASKNNNASNYFLNEGATYRIKYQNRDFTIKNKDGAKYIEYLIKNPNKEISANKLYCHIKSDTSLISNNLDTCTDISIKDDFQLPNQQITDDKTLIAVRGALSELNDKLTYETDKNEKEKIEEQIEKFEQYLKETTGLKGKKRNFSTKSGSNRSTISRAIRDCISEISKEHSELANHLKSYIKKGNFLVYEAKPSIVWN